MRLCRLALDSSATMVEYDSSTAYYNVTDMQKQVSKWCLDTNRVPKVSLRHNRFFTGDRPNQ